MRMAETKRLTARTNPACETACDSGEAMNAAEADPNHWKTQYDSHPKIQMRRKRSRNVRNTRIAAASMMNAADSWADNLGTTSVPAAYRIQSGRFIAVRLRERSFCKYHAATRYQSVFLHPLVTFGT